MDVVVMGTPDFAVPTLKRLIDSPSHRVNAVVTQPDKPKGRGKQMLYPPVKECALAHHIPVLQPARIKDGDFIEQLRAVPADVFVVAAYGQILPEAVLYMPRYGSLCVHGSLLPKYRGAAPIQWAVADGEAETGVTIMQMDKGIDTGDILLQKAFPILPEDTGADVHDKMAEIGADALLEALALLEEGKLVPIKQDDAQSSYAKMLTRDSGLICWAKPAKDIINLIRAFNPWPSAYTTYEGETIKIWRAEGISGFEDQNRLPGEILAVIKNAGFVVKTADGALLVTEVQGMGGKKMRAADYLRGHDMETGKILGL